MKTLGDVFSIDTTFWQKIWIIVTQMSSSPTHDIFEANSHMSCRAHAVPKACNCRVVNNVYNCRENRFGYRGRRETLYIFLVYSWYNLKHTAFHTSQIIITGDWGYSRSVSFSLAGIPWLRSREGCEMSVCQSTVLLLPPADKEGLGYEKLQKSKECYVINT
jgi:hypothetical protein